MTSRPDPGNAVSLRPTLLVALATSAVLVGGAAIGSLSVGWVLAGPAILALACLITDTQWSPAVDCGPRALTAGFCAERAVLLSNGAVFAAAVALDAAGLDWAVIGPILGGMAALFIDAYRRRHDTAEPRLSVLATQRRPFA